MRIPPLHLILFLVAAACGGSSAAGSTPDAGPLSTQASYEYPGCANEDYGCPRLLTLYCALRRIEAAHAGGCTQDAECTRANIQNRCIGYGVCEAIPVRADQRAAYESAAQAEVDRYCSDAAACRESPSCASSPDQFRAVCRGGRCVSERIDAGTM